MWESAACALDTATHPSLMLLTGTAKAITFLKVLRRPTNTTTSRSSWGLLGVLLPRGPPRPLLPPHGQRLLQILPPLRSATSASAKAAAAAAAAAAVATVAATAPPANCYRYCYSYSDSYCYSYSDLPHSCSFFCYVLLLLSGLLLPLRR